MNAPKKNSDIALYLRLLRYVVEYWPLFLISTAGFSLYAFTTALFADFLQLLIDVVGGEHGKSSTGIIARVMAWLYGGTPPLEVLRWMVPLSVVIIVVIQGIGFVLGNYWINHIARHLVYKLRREMFEHLLVIPASQYDRASSGHLLSRLLYNVEQVTGAATNAVKIVIREGFIVIGLAGFLLYKNWQLTLVFVAAAPLVALLVTAVGRQLRRISKRMQNSMGSITQVISESINNYREVRMFGGQPCERGRFDVVSEENLAQSMKMALLNAVSPPLIQFLMVLALAVLLWFAIFLVIQGQMSGGDFVSFIGAAAMIVKPIKQLSEVQGVIQKGLAGAESVFEFVDSQPEPDAGQYLSARVAGRIEFRDVSFSYEGAGEQVLKGVSFTVEPGQTVALVGRSGSGKSTLVSLLSRFYRQDSGSILLDGVEVGDYQLHNLRQQIAMVSQQVTLFNDTVRNNIAYGVLADCSDAALRKAAQASHALEFISQLPKGFDTEVGNDGDMLSGGQRQRIAIARALLKDAPVLVLDEATSALDNESERHIQAALEAAMIGRTTLVIAHRLSTIENADMIVVMESGQVVETGTHAELLALGGRYAQLHSRNFAD